MTKKDYIIIANILKDVRQNKLMPQSSFSYLFDRLVGSFYLDNTRFNKDKFIKAVYQSPTPTESLDSHKNHTFSNFCAECVK